MEAGSLEGGQSHLGSRSICKHKESQGQTQAPVMVFLTHSPSSRDLKGPGKEVSLLLKTDGKPQFCS